jgi:hypothetical protein
VAAVGDEGTVWVGPVHPELRLAAEGGQGFEGRLPAEGVDLDRQGAGAQGVDRLGPVGDYYQAILTG